jgi:hypothetical protein
MTVESYVELQSILFGMSIAIALSAMALAVVFGSMFMGLFNWLFNQVDRRVFSAKTKLFKEAEIYANLIRKRLEQAGMKRGRIMFYVTPEAVWLLPDWNLSYENKAWIRNNVSELCLACQREVRIYECDFQYWLKIERFPSLKEVTP